MTNKKGLHDKDKRFQAIQGWAEMYVFSVFSQNCCKIVDYFGVFLQASLSPNSVHV
jgi:hypothetical protein